MMGTAEDSKQARRFLKVALFGYAAALMTVGVSDLIAGSDTSNAPPEAIAFVESDATAGE